MLRDVVTSFNGVETWPCDEINYIIRHGNVRHPSDEFSEQQATTLVKSYLNTTFDKYAKEFGANILVEKTCANSLRVPFLHAVFPDAKYIFIVRDGVDATGSAKLRWTAKLDLAYILEKVRFVPKIDLPYYGLRYFWARLHRFFSKEKRLAFWGPALDNMQAILAKHTLNEVCAIQWQQCVEKSDAALNHLPKDQVCRVQYEAFVRDPKTELARVLQFMGVESTSEQLERAVAGVSAKSLGKGRKSLGKEEVAHLEGLVGKTLSKFGYLNNA
ncbi:sulfotransferase [Oleiphilus sp. HI0071]|nr:sulfotransferase [Oleiphilus sp. HI0065]KZY78446.1 sulfotransferase [Oleiphilus sp. HI0071]KZY93156.1 sulfotransferase [Oleiphilus sp. HI0073]KZZ17811.1 sulfotransferase [Oleiphilus sp. HI0080]KZZ47954.1 sulfotransferase [Oleiphilus sp. HI0122]KZZ77949.1 sulfotransferase [Oleiphilus sp. HI0133]